MLTDPAGFRCDVATLTLKRPLAELWLPHGTAVRRWLRVHEIDPERVAVGQPVRRDVLRRTLDWSEVVDGRDVTHRELAPDTDTWVAWPHPFPPTLLSASSFVDEDGYLLSPR